MKNRMTAGREIISAGNRAGRLGLVSASSGNISCRIDPDSIAITATGSSLPRLRSSDIITVELASGRSIGSKKASSELPLHRAIYLRFPKVQAIVHCHPCFSNAYFSLFDSLKAITFEARHFLGEVPVVRQTTVTVTRLEPVLRALKKNPMAVIKNHGVFSTGASLAECVGRIEMLEEAVKTAAIARLFARKNDRLDKQVKTLLTRYVSLGQQ